MSKLRRFLFRVIHAVLPGRAEAELDREISAHLAAIEDDCTRRGMSADDARLAAARILGGVEQTKELHRDARSIRWIDHGLRDVRQAVRTLARAPGFTTIAVLTLALGIGATTAILTVVEAVLLRPLPYDDPSRLVRVHLRLTSANGPRLSSLSRTDIDALAASASALDRLASYTFPMLTLTGDGHADTEGLRGLAVSANLFDTLGVRPLAGRSFLPHEDRPGGPRVAVISHRLWQRRFASDPGLIDAQVRLNGEPFTVIGVMSPLFYFPNPEIDMWLPIAAAGSPTGPAARVYEVIARVPRGRSATEVQRQLQALGRRLLDASGTGAGADSHAALVVTPHLDVIVGTVRTPLWLLLGAGAFVLLTACVNAANLLLIRNIGRAREIVIRAAIGATRGRLITQLSMEGLVLATLGGAGGLLLARWSLSGITRLFAGEVLPRAHDIALNPNVMAMSIGLTLIAAVLASVAPTLLASRVSGTDVLRQRQDTSGPTTHGRRLRAGFVVVQLASSVVLLIAMTVMGASLRQLMAVDPGFRVTHVFTARTSLPPARYPDGARVIQFFHHLTEALAAAPGVRAVGVTSSLPFAGVGPVRAVAATDGLSSLATRPADASALAMRQVSAGYLEALGIPLRRGRLFEAADESRAVRVAVISQRTAEQLWPGRDALGRTLRVLDADGAQAGPWHVIGIVGDISHTGLPLDATPALYVPHAQAGPQASRTMFMAVQTTADPDTAAAAVRKTMRDLDAEQPVLNAMTLAARRESSLLRPRGFSVILALFSGAALTLAALGLYGVLVHIVTQRTHEMGVRLALGASPRSLVLNVVGQGLRLAVSGLALGLFGAMIGSRLLSGMLYGISAVNATAYAAVAVVFLVLALAICASAARRVTFVDPIRALRND